MVLPAWEETRHDEWVRSNPRQAGVGTVAENLQDVLTGANIKSMLERESVVPEAKRGIPTRFSKTAVDLLTDPVLDPVGKIPEYEVCAVKVEAAQCLH